MGATQHGSLTSIILLVIANALIPISIITFAIGFFPYKPVLPGLAEYEPLDYGSPPDAPFDRLVFMMVDALRSDFVYAPESGFQYTQQLINDGNAIPFTANARSPTVTMPRIKCMTTGSIPSFVDLILNIDEGDSSSSLASQDTWLAQLKARSERKLLMYGDDTWLKLFPDTFDRVDGTSSFFVADFTEVDNNVTRNIADELQNDDWGLMVLHYLGLDHIGHKSGPRSVNMFPKQQEMDGIVRSLFTAMESKPHLESTLLVLCGDHGMNDAGNHGASSAGETSPALVFISPKLKQLNAQKYTAPSTDGADNYAYYRKVEQSDMAPTIAALLGFPVPKNNLGAFISEFLPFWPKTSDKVQLLVRNAKQILDIVTAAFGPELFDAQSTGADPCTMEATDVNELACSWRDIQSKAQAQASADHLDPAWESAAMAWLEKAQDLMSSMASNYDMPKLGLGLGLAALAVVISIGAATSQGGFGGCCSAPLGAIAGSYGVMMFASSYVEEEQHFWYWCSTLWMAVLCIRAFRRSAAPSSITLHITGLAALRIIRAWNQTGQKFAGDPDVVKTFLAPQPRLLWILVTATYFLVSLQILQNAQGMPYVAATGLTSTLVTSAFSFKLAFTAEDAPELVVGFAESMRVMLSGPSLLWSARIVFGLIGVIAAFSIVKSVTGPPRVARASSHLLHHLYTLLAMTQSRATNIPMFLLFNTLLLSLQSVDFLSTADITTTSILLQFASFFALGGSNAISSVDLSSAYNGISGFNVGAVGILTFVGNWAGPIFWTSATNLLLLQRFYRGDTFVFRRHVALLTAFTTVAVAFVMAACTALRTHLFIWTVFSPKYLYSMAWGLAQHLLINVGLGGFLFWLGAR